MLMKIINRAAGIILVLLVMMAGVVLLVSARSGDAWGYLADVIASNRWLGLGAGFGLMLLCLIYALSAIPRRSQQKYLSFDGENGTVSISAAAIAEYVGRVALEFPSIVRMKPEIIPARRSIDVHCYVQIKDGPDIHEVCELLQKRIKEVLAGSLGITQVRRIQVSVKEIVAQLKPD